MLQAQSSIALHVQQRQAICEYVQQTDDLAS